MKAFWSRCANGTNFGDVITRWLFEKFGVTLEWTKIRWAELVGCGSILGYVPDGYSGIVLGSGMMYSKDRKNLRNARVLALRGAHTKERCGLLSEQRPVLGDLGLTMAAFVPRDRTCEFRLGEIPHYTVYPDVARMYERHPSSQTLLIDVLAPVEDVIRQAARCERIVSSSLHGLILADCLGVPSMWIKDDRVLGNGFKFVDYTSAFGMSIEPGIWRQVPLPRVEARCRELMDLVREVAEEARDGST